MIKHSEVTGGSYGALPSSKFQFGEYEQYNRGGTQFVLGSLGTHIVEDLFSISQLWGNIC